MCHKYHMHGEAITLTQVIERMKTKSAIPVIPPKVVYSKQEILSASIVLQRLAARIPAPPKVIQS